MAGPDAVTDVNTWLDDGCGNTVVGSAVEDEDSSYTELLRQSTMRSLTYSIMALDTITLDVFHICTSSEVSEDEPVSGFLYIAVLTTPASSIFVIQ